MYLKSNRVFCFAHILNLIAHTFTHQFDNAAKHKKWRHTQAKAAKHGVNDTVGSISSSGTNLDSDCASGSDGEPKDGDLWEDEPEMGDESKPTGWNALAGLDDWVNDLAVLSDVELNNVVEASAPVQKVLSKASLLSPDTIYC